MRKLITILIGFLIAFLWLYIVLKVYVNQQRPAQEVQPTSEVKVGVANNNKQVGIKSGFNGEDAKRNSFSTALVSWYDRSTCGQRIYGKTCKTASGEIFNEEAKTLACDSRFELGTVFEFCYLGKCTRAVCDDRGRFSHLGRLFDFSRGLFSYFSDLDVGVIEVEYRVENGK